MIGSAFRRPGGRGPRGAAALAVLLVLPAAAAVAEEPPQDGQDEPAPPPVAPEPPVPTPPVAPTQAPTPPAPTPGPKPTPAPAPTAAPPETPSSATPSAPPAEAKEPGPGALRSAIEGVLGAPVHGSLGVRWQTRLLRDGEDEWDHDLRGQLDLFVGDEESDRWSGGLLMRTDWDVGDRHDDGTAFGSLADTFDHEVSTVVHAAYAQWRPETGNVETVRAGRQFIDVAESFHVDGVSVGTRPLTDSGDLRVRGYAGVPVHLYERGSSGDWLAGARVSAQPWSRTRAAVDVAHVQDELAGYTKERDDLAAVSVWQRVGADTELNGRFTWLHGPADARLGATVAFPASDLLVSASYRRLLEDRDELSTQFDPYYEALRTYYEYHVGDVRAVKGFGDRFRVEAGVSGREVVHDSDVGPFNRNTRRVWLTPSVDDLLWAGSTLSAGVDSWSGDGERIRTWTVDLSHRFARGTWVSLGSDFALYDYGRLEQGERSHVRTVYARARIRLSDVWSLDVRQSWERSEEETFHVVSAALTLDF